MAEEIEISWPVCGISLTSCYAKHHDVIEHTLSLSKFLCFLLWFNVVDDADDDDVVIDPAVWVHWLIDCNFMYNCVTQSAVCVCVDHCKSNTHLHTKHHIYAIESPRWNV